jgi:hypothetical protein
MVDEFAINNEKKDDLMNNLLLTDLSQDIQQSIADNLRGTDVKSLRLVSKILHTNIKKPKKLLHKYDIRNYFKESLAVELEMELDLENYYAPNEAKILFLAKELNKNYDNDNYLKCKHNRNFTPLDI